MRLRVPGSLSALRSASLSFFVTSGGVPFGAKIAFQALTWNSGRPPSFVVGTSGSAGERCGSATAYALIVPAWICGTRFTI